MKRERVAIEEVRALLAEMVVEAKAEARQMIGEDERPSGDERINDNVADPDPTGNRSAMVPPPDGAPYD